MKEFIMRFTQCIQDVSHLASKFRYKKAVLFGLTNLVLIKMVRRFFRR